VHKFSLNSRYKNFNKIGYRKIIGKIMCKSCANKKGLQALKPETLYSPSELDRTNVEPF